MDMLSVEEIKRIRGRYGLTQKSFALLLGIGPASMVRYEQGVKPSKANANLIRAARHPEFMRECLMRDGDLLSKRQRELADHYVYAYVSLEDESEEGAASLAAQMASLREKAGNLACETMSYLIDHDIDANDSANPMALILKQLLDIKKRLENDSILDEESVKHMQGYCEYTEQIVNQLNQMP